MPNIEIHGLQFNPEDLFAEDRVEQLIDTIHQLFDGKPFQRDYVITNVLSDVSAHDGNPSPFLRICTTNAQGELEDILNTLVVLKMDMEVLILQRFIPRS